MKRAQAELKLYAGGHQAEESKKSVREQLLKVVAEQEKRAKVFVSISHPWPRVAKQFFLKQFSFSFIRFSRRSRRRFETT